MSTAFVVSVIIASIAANLFYEFVIKRKKRKPMATMNGKIHVYSEGSTMPPETYTGCVVNVPNPSICTGKLMSGKEAKNLYGISKTRAKAEIVGTVRRKITELESLIEEPKPAPKKKPKAMTAPVIPKGFKRNTGKMPRGVKKNTIVSVIYRDGEKKKEDGFDMPVLWGLSGCAELSYADILYYSIVKPKRKSK